MDKEILQSSVRLKFGTGKYPGMRTAVLQEVKDSLPLAEVEDVYKCGEGRDWYFTFTSARTANRLSDETFLSTSGTPVKIESLDRRRIRFRIHWFPFHMKGDLVEEFMEEYGSQVQIEYELQNVDGISMKTGTIAETMICSESQYQSLPYNGNIHGRVVLMTVMGRQTVCLRCGDIGHQRSTCPHKPPPTKSYAAAARGDEWTTVGISRQMPTIATQAEAEIVQPVEEVAEGTEHVPLSPESEVGVVNGPP